MTAVKRKKVQKLLGLGLPGDASEEEIYNALDEYLRIPATALEQDPIAAFTKITNYSEEILAIKTLVRDLIDYNVIRVKGSVVYEGEHVWARSVEELELTLADPKNSDIYDSFKDKVKNKMKLTVI